VTGTLFPVAPYAYVDGAPEPDGVTYSRANDYVRLSGQNEKVRVLMRDGVWRTLSEISSLIDVPEASVSARLRDLRKQKFGGNIVDRRHRGDVTSGHYEYRLTETPLDTLPRVW
jgi:hypothetical protein